jgi:L-fucono-1,5-lactonase
MTPATVLIDAHHHLWDPARRDYPWLAAPSLEPIRRPYGVADLRSRTAANGVTATVLVQTVSDLGETEEFLAVAGNGPAGVAGVVGWVDLTAPDVAEEIARLRGGPGGGHLVGIRHQVQDEPDPGWLLRTDVGRGISAVGAAGLVYDLLVLEPQLDAARQVVAAHPEMTFVLDHCAKPPIASGGWQPWADGISRLAALPNVVCKVSGLVTEAVWDAWDADTLRPYVEHALGAFGADRLLFGSDWPVCELAGSYDQVLAAARETLAALSPTQAAGVFGGNAIRVYGLAGPSSRPS